MKKLTVLVLWGSVVCANPTGAEVVSGEAAFSGGANLLEVTTGPQSIIHWEDFSIGSGEVTRFVQPSSDSAVLNKVVGPNMSQIMGRLEANGKVFLINPSGVIVGPQGIVQTAGFVASTFDLPMDDFLNIQVSDKKGLIIVPSGAVSIEGTIQVNPYELAIQTGQLTTGKNSSIEAKNVDITLGKGISELKGSVEGSVAINGPDSTLYLSGSIDNAERVAIDVRHYTGSVSMNAGEVVINTSQGFIDTRGASIDATNSIYITCDEGRLFSSASYAVSDGGSIALIAKDTALVGGSIIAIDGFVEISGKESLSNGASLQLGKGELLIDPNNIVIDGSVGLFPQFLLVDPDPSGGGSFAALTILTNGNIVVTNDTRTIDDNVNAGAIYLYDGTTYALISSITGSNANDDVGIYAPVSLSDGNIVFACPTWNSNAGAATWMSATASVTEVVSGSNSIIGTSAGDSVSNNGITVLLDGNFAVGSALWNGNVGALTWSDGTVVGEVSASNSLVGSSSGDYVGTNVLVLSNGNYIEYTSSWNGNMGAVTWVDGSNGNPCNESSPGAVISASNSLVGTSTGDNVSLNGIAVVGETNYVVQSGEWNGDLGAATWGSGTSGIAGDVSVSNSLIGSTPSDNIGSTVTVLTNGNYVVNSVSWSSSKGSVTWGSGTSGVTGTVSVSNSLIGAVADDEIGSAGIATLANGNYVVRSQAWNVSTGAVTWGSGTGPTTGVVSSSNSLVGSHTGEALGESVAPLPNSNYVVNNAAWTNGGTGTDLGAVTLCSGTGPTGAVVSTSNSLYGTTNSDRVGYEVYSLGSSSHHYVVTSQYWSGGMGAVTWQDGTSVLTGAALSSSNSLVGGTSGDFIGTTFTLLSNGNYVVSSTGWTNPDGPTEFAGAATWGSGTTPITGLVSNANSLVGTHASDEISSSGVVALAVTGNYVVVSPNWNNTFGAFTWGDGSAGTVGDVSGTNSCVGSATGDSIGTLGAIELTNGNYVVSSPAWNASTGASTWASGSSATVGIVSGSNSLTGSTPGDNVGGSQAIALTNGNYLVVSLDWNGGIGAATWGDGAGGTTVGVVSASNSLTTASTADRLASGGITPLTDGNYVICTPHWNGYVGAVTWGSGTEGVSGLISSDNSLVGVTSGDHIGYNGITQLNANAYIINSLQYGGGDGAFTWASAAQAITGPVSDANTIFGQDSYGNYESIALDATTGTFFLEYYNQVVAGLYDPTTITFNRGSGFDISIYPGALEDLINNGATVTFEANENITINNALLINEAGAGDLHLTANGNILINSDITADANNIVMIAGVDMISSNAPTIISTSGNVTLVVDNLYPTPQSYGSGAFTIGDMTFSVGGDLQFYSSQANLDTFPSTINGEPFATGDHTTNGVYYDNGTGGVPYAIFYKTGSTPPPPPSPVPPVFFLPSSSVASYYSAISEALYKWQFQIFSPYFKMVSPSLLGEQPDQWNFWITQVGNQDIYE